MSWHQPGSSPVVQQIVMTTCLYRCTYIPGNKKDKPVSTSSNIWWEQVIGRKNKQKSTEKEWALKNDPGRLF